MDKGQGSELVLPHPLVAGDRIVVVAPSSPFDRDELLRGMAWMRGRYRVAFATRIFDRQGYLAGDDERRLRELEIAMTAPGIKAVVAARGGYGLTRIVARLPWARFAAAPRWLVGFSDVTALHVMAWRHGVASIHAPHGTGLGRTASPRVRFEWLRALEIPGAHVVWNGLRSVHRGVDDGPLDGIAAGGNLALLETMAAQGHLRLPDPCILFLEDVSERPYRLDRMLTALLEGGHFDSVRAVVLGQFSHCDPGPDGVTAARVLEERTSRMGVRVLAGAPFGHEATNFAFVLGARVRVYTDRVEWGAGEVGQPRGEGGLVRW